jgi:hypothetical protein
MVLVTDSSPSRAGGTIDRTTPTANTAAPMAKAGRSIASRQSLGRCGACRRGACRRDAGRCDTGRCEAGRRWRRPGTRRQIPSAPLAGWLAWDGPDRIFSRIRSRPSAPGCT